MGDFDSSSPSGFQAGPPQFLTLGALLALLAGGFAVLLRRRQSAGG
jgi:LPXTG-motif cell wall-anchored protein